MIVPTTPVPTPVYPAGIQASVVLQNVGDTAVTVSPISAPLSGFSLSKGGSIEWPAQTPLWVYGEDGGFLSVGLGSALSATPFIPAPIVNVQVPVTTTPTTDTPPSSGGSTPTDEDEMRVYSSAQIAALTASDKATNYTIWNTDTQSLNYVVNGQVIAPSYGGTLKAQGTYSGTGAAQSIALPFTPDLVLVGTMFGTTNAAGIGSLAVVHRSEDPAQFVAGIWANNGGNSSAFSTAVLGTNALKLLTNSTLNTSGTTYGYTAFKFNASTVQAVSSSKSSVSGKANLGSMTLATDTTNYYSRTFTVPTGYGACMFTYTSWPGQVQNNAQHAFIASANGANAHGFGTRDTTNLGPNYAAIDTGTELTKIIAYDTQGNGYYLSIRNLTYNPDTGVVTINYRNLSGSGVTIQPWSINYTMIP